MKWSHTIRIHDGGDPNIPGKLLRYSFLLIIPILVLLAFTMNFSVDAFPKQRLASARMKWSAQANGNYQMEVRVVSPFSNQIGSFPYGEYLITVNQGKVIAVSEHRNWLAAATDPNYPYTPAEISKVGDFTMDRLFDYAQTQMASLSDVNVYSCGQNRVEANYDAGTGAITSLQWTCAGGWLGCGVSDCNGSIVVKSLKFIGQ